MDIEQARFNMVEQQIRTWEVLDQEVLDLLFTVKREDFVPAAYRMLAFADLELPLGDGERMWTPKIEARVVQDLALAPGDEVLEVGTGSGYLTALLASRSAVVTSVECNARLAADAARKLARAGIRKPVNYKGFSLPAGREACRKRQKHAFNHQLALASSNRPGPARRTDTRGSARRLRSAT